MLTAPSAVEFVRQRGGIVLEVTSVVIRLAITHVAQEAGWYPCRHERPGCGCIRVTDRLGVDDPHQILIVREVPADCQIAVEAIVQGRAASVVLADEPEALHAVFAALEHRSMVVPRRVADLAAHAPRLNPRLRRTLRLLAAGRSNQGIAEAQHQSISTTKRDIAELFELFDVENRAALTRSASALGFV